MLKAFLLILCLLLAAPAYAQTVEFELPASGGSLGGPGRSGIPALDQEGLLMLQAMQKAMTGDFKGAEQVYSSIINANPGSADAYLHRSIMRRQLKDTAGSQSDAKSLITLTNSMLRQNPSNPTAYHHRGMAYRMLGNYRQAMQDIQTGLERGGDPDWKNDLRDTALEEKASSGITQ